MDSIQIAWVVLVENVKSQTVMVQDTDQDMQTPRGPSFIPQGLLWRFYVWKGMTEVYFF